MYWNRDRSRMLAFNHHVVTALHTIQSKSEVLKSTDGLLGDA